MTEAQARELAKGDRSYMARQAKDGTWYVWDCESDHTVEFQVDAEGAVMSAPLKANTYNGELSKYRTVDHYKVAGRPYHAGMAAFMLGTGETYGCHFGFRSTYHTSTELFHAGFAMARAIHAGVRSWGVRS